MGNQGYQGLPRDLSVSLNNIYYEDVLTEAMLFRIYSRIDSNLFWSQSESSAVSNLAHFTGNKLKRLHYVG